MGNKQASPDLKRKIVPPWTELPPVEGDCAICLQETQVFTLHGSHLVCKTCVGTLLTAKLSKFGVEDVTRCELLSQTGASCPHSWRHTDFSREELGLDQSLIDLFKRIQITHYQQCPSCLSCSSLRKSSKSWVCRCGARLCFHCGALATDAAKSSLEHNSSCKNAKSSAKDSEKSEKDRFNELRAQALVERWQCCKDCKVLIQKQDGCNYVQHFCMAARAEVALCYVCGFLFTDPKVHNCTRSSIALDTFKWKEQES